MESSTNAQAPHQYRTNVTPTKERLKELKARAEIRRNPMAELVSNDEFERVMAQAFGCRPKQDPNKLRAPQPKYGWGGKA